MEDKDAIEHLVEILKKYGLTDEEQDAVKTAIGVLSWTKLRQGAIRNIVKKRGKLPVSVK